jgi:hypothetical protein
MEKQILEDFWKDGKEAYRTIRCRNMARFAWFQDEDDLGNFPLIRKVFENERGIKNLNEEFDGCRR